MPNQRMFELFDKDKKVTMENIVSLSAVLNGGVSVRGAVYDGIKLNVDAGDGELLLYLANSSNSQYKGLDYVFKLASGRRSNAFSGNNSAFMLLMTMDPSVLNSEINLYQMELDKDNLEYAVGELSGQIKVLKSYTAMITDGLSPSNAASLSEYFKTVLTDKSALMASHVSKNVDALVRSCFDVVAASRSDTKVKALFERNKLAATMSLLISHVIFEYMERLLPAHLPGVSSQIIQQVRNKVVKSTDVSAHILSSSVIRAIRAFVDNNFSTEYVYGASLPIGDFILNTINVFFNTIAKEVDDALHDIGLSTMSISSIAGEVLDKYMEIINDTPGLVQHPVKIGGATLPVDTPTVGHGLVNIAGIVYDIDIVVEHIISVSVGEEYIRRLWSALVDQESVPVNTISDSVYVPSDKKKSPLHHNLYDGLETHQYENWSQLMRAAGSKLLSKGLYTDAAQLIKYASDSVYAEVEEILDKVMAVMISIRALEQRFGPEKISGGQDNFPISIPTIILSGECSDRYSKAVNGVAKIAIPINDSLPIIRRHLDMLKSIEDITFLYAMPGSVYRLVHNTIYQIYDRSNVGYIPPSRNKDIFFVARRVKRPDDIKYMLMEQVYQSLAIALYGSRHDVDNNISKLLLSDADYDVKSALFAKIIHESGALKSISSGLSNPADSAEMYANLKQHIKNDVGRLGISYESGRTAMFVAACKLYLAAEKYHLLEKKIPTKAQRIAGKYYDAGTTLSKIIRSGKLPEYSRLVMASVRSNDFNHCPFGLDIPDGCKNVDGHIDKMSVVMDNDNANTVREKERINQRIFRHIIDSEDIKCGKCKYARYFMRADSGAESVVCNYGEANAGGDSVDFSGGVGAAYPTSFWAGLFSTPNPIGPEARDSYLARSPGVTPFGMTQVNIPGM